MLKAFLVGAMASIAFVSVASSQTSLDYKTRPVFFEMFQEEYSDMENFELFRAGKVRMQPLGTESVKGFDWVNHTRSDESWWHRIEGFVYLLPLIESDLASDRQLLSDWFNKWYEVHVLNDEPNPGAWDAMVASRRVMVLIHWLKKEEARGGDEKMLRNMRRMIERHQRFLQKEENFDAISNHGMWESIALFETTRVFPSADLTQVALDRLITLTKAAVSQQGIEKEHSPAYHFYFLDWLSHYAEYLGSLDLNWGQGVRDLNMIKGRMVKAAHFLNDHTHKLPQIGDTDLKTLEDRQIALISVSEEDFLYDPESGLAIFKDTKEARSSRYVIFCNQNEQFRPLFRYHYHNDMMSVYYNHGGEVILGDAGRLSYSRTDLRSYLMSLAAHNTIFPKALIVPRTPGIFVAKDVWAVDERDSVMFGAALIDDVVRREVVVFRGENRVKVVDSLNSPDVFILLWRFGPDVADYKEGKVVKWAEWRTYEWELRTKGKQKFKLAIRVDGRNGMQRDEMAIVAGEKDPYLGWYSPGYDKTVPSPTIKLMLNPRSAEESLHVTTEIIRID
jgi:hypothetical protein